MVFRLRIGCSSNRKTGPDATEARSPRCHFREGRLRKLGVTLTHDIPYARREESFKANFASGCSVPILILSGVFSGSALGHLYETLQTFRFVEFYGERKHCRGNRAYAGDRSPRLVTPLSSNVIVGPGDTHPAIRSFSDGVFGGGLEDVVVNAVAIAL